MQIWPHTPIGRRILNLRPGKRERRVTNHLTRDGGPLDGLIGKRGVAKTELLPSGLVVIEDHKYDAISYGEPIEQGSKVAVASITAGKIHVRLVTEDEGQQPGHVSSDGVQSPAALELPLDSLDID